MKSVSLRIRRCYFDQIVKGNKKVELRKLSPFWARRLGNATPDIAVFICGKQTHRRRITRVTIENPKEVLGRQLSEQGKRDVPGDRCYAIWLGEDI